MTSEIIARIEMRQLPVAIFAEARQHSEAVLREFAFIATDDDRSGVPARLLSVVTAVRHRYGHLNADVGRTLDDAIARGDDAVDLELQFPVSLAAGAREFGALLDEVEVFCQSGDLLTLASSPDVRLFRAWYLEEIVRQLGGAEPMPWPQYASERRQPA